MDKKITKVALAGIGVTLAIAAGAFYLLTERKEDKE